MEHSARTLTHRVRTSHFAKTASSTGSGSWASCRPERVMGPIRLVGRLQAGQGSSRGGTWQRQAAALAAAAAAEASPARGLAFRQTVNAPHRPCDTRGSPGNAELRAGASGLVAPFVLRAVHCDIISCGRMRVSSQPDSAAKALHPRHAGPAWPRSSGITAFVTSPLLFLTSPIVQWAAASHSPAAEMASRPPGLLGLSDDTLTLILSLLDQDSKWVSVSGACSVGGSGGRIGASAPHC